MIRFNTLKDALRDTIHTPGHRPDELAEEIGVSYSYLTNAANENLDNFHFQLRHLKPLIRATSNYAVLDHLEHSLGRVAITLPASGKCDARLNAKLFSKIEHFGCLVKNAASALERGPITSRVAKDLERDIFVLIQRSVLFMVAIQQAVEKTQGGD